MLNTMSVRTTIAAFLATLSMAVHAMADSPRELNVPAGELVKALESLAKQSDIDLIYQARQLKGIRTLGLRGSYSAQEAVSKLLEGTPLVIKTDSSGAILISRPPVAPPQKTSVESVNGPLRLADPGQEVVSTTPDGDTAREEKSEQTDEEIKAPQKGIPEILVRGQKNPTLNADIERTENDIQPYVVMSREDIERSGAQSVDDLLRTKVTMNYVAVPDSQKFDQGGNKSSIALRGLDASQTLILVDGRRIPNRRQGSGSGQPDINGIPLSAIERIEILPSTASAIYGGSATGGVVNVVLRRKYYGIETAVTYENALAGGGGLKRIDLVGGHSLNDGRTQIFISGSYSTTDALQFADRSFISDRYRSVEDVPGTADPGNFNLPPSGATTNIKSWAFAVDPNTGAFGLAPLTLKDGTFLNSTIAHVPQGYAGFASDPENGHAFLDTAGHFNFSPANTSQFYGLKRNIGYGPTVKSLSATLRQKLNSRLDLFLDLSASSNSSSSLQNGLTASALVPSSAPNNPFNQDILVTAPAYGADHLSHSLDTSRRGLLGFIFQLPKAWSGELDFAHQRTTSSYDYPLGGLTASGYDSIASGALDVLQDASAFPFDFGAYEEVPNLRVGPTVTRFDDLSLRMGGAIGSLPAGKPMVSVLVERREQKFDESTTSVLNRSLSSTPIVEGYSGAHQEINSLYAEVSVPLMKALWAKSESPALDLQLASRYDEYRTAGAVPLPASSQPHNEVSSVDPTIGLRFRPVDDLMLRASYGTGFLPPDLGALQPQPAQVITPDYGFTDPKRGNELLGAHGSVSLLSGGNPDLNPEDSRSWSAGIVLTPRAIDGLRVSFDYSQIKKQNNIDSISIGIVGLGLEDAVPGLVTRAPASGDGFSVGPITQFDSRLRNIANAKVRAYDMVLDYSFELHGTWHLSAAGTHMTVLDKQFSRLSEIVDTLGLVTSPEWTGIASLDWMRGPLELGWNGRYADSYWVVASHEFVSAQGSDRVKSDVYHDVYASYSFERSIFGLSGLEVRGGIKNVLDKKPRFSVAGSLYLDPWISPVGATYYVTVKKAFGTR